MSRLSPRLQPCTLCIGRCPVAPSKMVVGDPEPWKPVKHRYAGQLLRSRIERGYFERLYCVNSPAQGIRNVRGR